MDVVDADADCESIADGGVYGDLECHGYDHTRGGVSDIVEGGVERSGGRG